MVCWLVVEVVVEVVSNFIARPTIRSIKEGIANVKRGCNLATVTPQRTMGRSASATHAFRELTRRAI